MKACLLLICLNLPQQLFLFIVEETIYKVKSIMSSLQDHLSNLFPFCLNGLNNEILNSAKYTILDFSSSKAEMRERILSCILL